MATTQAARTDTIIIMVDGDELKLSVTTRAPVPEQPNPPTETQLARIRTGCVMQYTVNYRKALSGEWTMETFDPDLKSPIRYVAENSDDNQQIQPSIADPYVTVWQMGNWSSNNPPSLTLHDYDSGNTILQLSAICEASNDKLREVFNTGSGIKGMQLLYISSFKRFSQEHSDDTVSQSTPDNTNRIGKNAETLPDTPAKSAVDFSQFKPYVRKTKAGLAANLISIETGKKEKPNFNTQAQIGTKYDYKEIPYDASAIVAFQIIGAINVQEFTNGETNEVTRSVSIPLAGGNAYRLFDRGGEHNYDWSSFAHHIGTDSDGLRALVGQSVYLPAYYLTLKISESKGKKFYNYHGLYHDGHEVNEKPMLVDAKDSIPF